MLSEGKCPMRAECAGRGEGRLGIDSAEEENSNRSKV